MTPTAQILKLNLLHAHELPESSENHHNDWWVEGKFFGDFVVPD